MANQKILVLERSQSLADQVRSVLDELTPRPAVVTCERIASVNELFGDEGPFDALVAGPSMATKTGLARLQQLHDAHPGTQVILAFEDRPQSRLRDIVRTGAVDMLLLPVEDDELVDALRRALGLADHQAPAGAPAVDSRPRAPGTVFTVGSATGGCGKTFYATNLAYFLTKHTNKRACIVDLDLQFGEVSTGLRLRPRFTISDALDREESEDIDLHSNIHEFIVTHETGIHVLPAPKDPSEADRVSPPDIARIIDAVRARYDYVIVDTPAALTETVLAAFDLSDQLYVLATLDLPSVRNMAVFLNTLSKLKIPADNIRLVLNKEESDVGINVEQVTKMFPQGFSSVLPYSREVSKSINVGMPVLAFAPQTEVSRRLAAGMRPLLPAEDQHLVDESTGARKLSWFRRLFQRDAHPQLTSS